MRPITFSALTFIAIAMPVSRASADLPVRLYCGGAVEASSQEWWIRDGADASARRVDTKPAACPPISASMTFPKGLGQSSPPALPETGGSIGPSGSLYMSVSPRSGIEGYAVVGRLLGEIFSGPGYNAKNKSVADQLSSIRANLGGMNNMLQKDTDFIRQTYTSTLRSQISADVSNLGAKASSDLAAAQVKNATLNHDLKNGQSAAQTYDPTQVGNSIESITRGGYQEALKNSVGPDHLTASGPDILPGMEDLRRQSFGVDNGLRAEIEREAAKVSAALPGATGNNAVALRNAQLALAAARDFEAAGTNLSRATASSLLREAESRRLAAAGLLRRPVVAVWNGKGGVSEAVIGIDGKYKGRAVIDDFAAYQRQSVIAGVDEAQLNSTIDDGQSSAASKAQASRALQASATAQSAARLSFFAGDPAASKAEMELGVSMLDFALNVGLAVTVPEVLLGKLAFEAITGTRLLDGATLSDADRSFAAINALTLGFGTEIAAGVRALGQIEAVAGVTQGLTNAIADAKQSIALAAAIRGAEATEPLILRTAVVEVDQFAVTKRLSSLENLAGHFGDHGAEFGTATKEAYLDAAKKFASSTSLDIMAVERAETAGVVVKWNFVTDEFGVFKPDGNIITYYKLGVSKPLPEGSKMIYFLKQAALQTWK